MTDLKYWRDFLDWVDLYYEMYANEPGPCGFAVMFARRGYEAALRDADRGPGDQP